jgi:hypothetical protein
VYYDKAANALPQQRFLTGFARYWSMPCYMALKYLKCNCFKSRKRIFFGNFKATQRRKFIVHRFWSILTSYSWRFMHLSGKTFQRASENFNFIYDILIKLFEFTRYVHRIISHFFPLECDYVIGPIQTHTNWIITPTN